MWDGLEHYSTYRPMCMDTIEYQKHVANIQIFEILAGLNSKFKQVRDLILAKDPLPSMNEVYGMFIERNGVKE